jgi:hypothetical protein
MMGRQGGNTGRGASGGILLCGAKCRRDGPTWSVASVPTKRSRRSYLRERLDSLALPRHEQEAAVVDWYWWAACRIFIGVETFNRAMGEHPLPTLEGIRYIPRRLQTPAAGFKINNLVEHFVKCGLRPRDAESIFRDFASHYLAHVPQASEPNWSNVSPPAATSRRMVKERVKLRRKEFKAMQTESRPDEAQHGQRARDLAPAQVAST